MDFSKIVFLSDEEIEKKKEEEKKVLFENRAFQFKKMIPASFQETDETLLNQENLKKVKNWAWNNNPNKLNLLLYGKTGTGKTRSGWISIKLRYIKNGHMPMSIGAETFARRIINEQNLMNSHARSPILLLDDLGKERNTPTAESAIFELIRERMDHKRPTIITTNFDLPDLINRFNHQDTGKAIARRLKEISYCVKFS